MTKLKHSGHAAGVSPIALSDDHLIGEHEAAARLGLAVATLRRWRWAGRGPAFRKLGAAVRYSLVDLTAFSDAARRTSTTRSNEDAA
jgi:hypothetical protein